MNIRNKTLLIVGATFLVLFTLLIGISRFVVMGSFQELEEQNTRLNVTRTLSELSSIISNINTSLGDWAPWDETYQFVKNGNDAYIKGNLQTASIANLRLNFMIFINSDGKVVFVKCVDLNTGREVALFDGLIEKIYSEKELVEHPTTSSSKTGIIMFSETPIFIASQPILKSDFSGPVGGSLIFGRYMDEAEIKRLSEMTSLSLDIRPVGDPKMPRDFQEAAETFSESVNIVVKPLDAEYIAGYALQKDIRGKPAFILKVQLPRKIYSHGQRTFLYYVFSLSVVAGVFILVIMFFLGKFVISPLSLLSENVSAIGSIANFSGRLSVTSKDELGNLAGTINLMLEQLSESRKKIQEQSYRSGMAEMAAGVLHNVRNSLNPLLGNVEIIRSKIRKMPTDKIEILKQELENPNISEARRNDLIHFSLLMNHSMANLLGDMDVGLSEAVDRIHHIEAILDDHQQWAHSEHPSEPIHFETFIQDIVRFLKEDWKQRIEISIDPGISEIGVVMFHRIVLDQVMVNILINAAESIQRKGLTKGEVHIAAWFETHEDSKLIHIRVCDNGEGIDHSMRERIFERGFSTKQKSSGIGLHWCANTIASMKGRIYAESDGPGMGACFHVILPYQTVEEHYEKSSTGIADSHCR